MTQKAVASSDGSAIVAVVPMAAGKQVFRSAIITPPTVMQSMTSEDTTNKKRPTAVKKVRLAPVQKQLPRKFTSTLAENMENTINTRQVMGMVGMGLGMLVASVGMIGVGIRMVVVGMGMVGMGVLVGMVQPSGNSEGVAFS